MKKSFLVLGFFSLAAIGAWTFLGDTRAEEALGRNPSSMSDFPTELGEVWGARQDQIAEKIAQSSVETAQKNASDGIVRRDAHPKHHGCVKGKFKILENNELPEVYRVGIYETPGREWPAWIRFSNGSPSGAHADDHDRDLRGMAVKLMGVEDSSLETQDLVMCNSPVFFSKNAEDYLDLHKALEGKLTLLGYLATHPRNAMAILKAQVGAPKSPLELEYFSSVPYKLGSASSRFQVTPCAQPEGASSIEASSDGPDYLRAILWKTLAKRTACFDFYLQINQDPGFNPVEDPRLEWSLSRSPKFKVAQLEIYEQVHEGNGQDQFCENLSFNPWNSGPSTRPLGQIGRIRKIVYDQVSKFRHEKNAVPRIEPHNHQPCQTEDTKSLCAEVAHKTE